MKIRSSINLPWGHVMSHKKFGPDRFSRLTFIGYKQTNRQTDKLNYRLEEKRMLSLKSIKIVCKEMENICKVVISKF